MWLLTDYHAVHEFNTPNKTPGLNIHNALKPTHFSFSFANSISLLKILSVDYMFKWLWYFGKQKHKM